MNRATCRTLLERQVAFCRISFIQSFYFCLKVSHIFGQIFFILKIVLVGIGADLHAAAVRLDELHIGEGGAACQHQQRHHGQQAAAALFLRLLRFWFRLCHRLLAAALGEIVFADRAICVHCTSHALFLAVADGGRFRCGRIVAHECQKVSFIHLVQKMHGFLALVVTVDNEIEYVTLAKVPNWGQRELVEPFNSLLREFCTHTKQSESMAETTRNVARSAIRRFLFEMEDHGFRSLADFTLINVNGCVTSFAAHYAGGLGSAIFSVRLFLRFLFERNLTITDLSQSLPELMATRKMFHEGFTEDELEYLLEHPDRTTAIGKRDYAMMVLAAQSGLRACDVVRLELGSIDWRAREIRLVQHKTGEPLSLPLEAESGNAIADYILNGRPDSALPNIFLCHTGVIRPLDARSASGVVSKHMKLAGIPAKRRAFHALRRTFGTRLLQNEVSFELIQQLLGHRDMDSMKLYLSIDEQGLKQCALPLLSHRKAGG